MLTINIATSILLDWLNDSFHKIMLLLDAIVYWAISVSYQLFMVLARERIFKEEFFSSFARRIYAILGVFMLFYLAYALLNALVDPEKLSKGDKSVSKIAMNLVISLILLGLTPTIFNYAYDLQNYILSSNLIGALVLGTSTDDVNPENDEVSKYGRRLAFDVMNAFINPENYNVKFVDTYTWENYKSDVLEEGDFLNLPGLSGAIVYGRTQATGNTLEDFKNVFDDSKTIFVTYYMFVSTAAGVFLLYMIFSFTLDLGVRVFKFAFCQLLAPIPIVMRALPGKKAQFDKWLKLTMTVYFEVFVRVGLMYLAIYFISSIKKNVNFTLITGDNVIGKIAFVILIMGIFAFAKQAPKMLSEMLGIDSGNIKLGITDKLKASGPIGNVLNKGIGAVSGSLGGLSTGIFDKNINTWAAMRQGAAAGFKKGGAQYGAQRTKTFESAYGYGVEQGIFGGRSIGQRINDANKDSVVHALNEYRNKIVTNYEDKSVFKDEFNSHLNNGVKFRINANSIKNGKYVSDFDAAENAARDYATQHNIAFSDRRAQEVRKKYLEDLMNTTTDENKKRAINSAMNAEKMYDLWMKKTVSGISWNSYARQTDAQIDANTTLSAAEKSEIKSLKATWLQNAKNYTENLADGTYTRKTDGHKDELYNKDYAEAHKPTEIRKESDSDLLRKLLNK